MTAVSATPTANRRSPSYGEVWSARCRPGKLAETRVHHTCEGSVSGVVTTLAELDSRYMRKSPSHEDKSILHTVQIGVSPSDVAVDAQTGRVLVVNSYSDTHGKGALKAWHPYESWWPQVLRRIRQVICCLPFQAPSPPAPTTNGTVMTLDLARL